MYTFDYPLFLLLNFDGGPVMDTLMKVVSTPASWAWLYLLMLWLVWRRSGWRGALLFLVLVAAAVGLSDLIAGIFKHSGLLKNLWPSFPARLRPMYTPELEGQVHVVKQGGMYGTVSAHAATMVSMAVLAIGTIGRRWFTWLMVASVVVICYSRIYMAYHFPVDIALGAMVGLVAGGSMLALYRALERRKKRITN
ncbi:MAG: phosphatase PAP2 family protein [Alistipes sp.]|nr:phosphatase PAP2 family protein [Alistipes sp.]